MIKANWYEVAEWLESGELDGLHYEDTEKAPGKIKKVTAKTKLTFYDLAKYTWYYEEVAQW